MLLIDFKEFLYYTYFYLNLFISNILIGLISSNNILINHGSITKINNLRLCCNFEFYTLFSANETKYTY